LYIDRKNQNQISNKIKGFFIPETENIHSYAMMFTSLRLNCKLLAGSTSLTLLAKTERFSFSLKTIKCAEHKFSFYVGITFGWESEQSFIH